MDSPEWMVRLFYLVGGRHNAQRVCVASLFGRYLAARHFVITWVILKSGQKRAWHRETWNGQAAFVIGQSARCGMLGSVLTLLFEIVGDFRGTWQALRGDFDIIQVRDNFLGAVLGLAVARMRRKPFVFWLSFPIPESRLADAREGRAKFRAYSYVVGRLSGLLLYRVILPLADHAFVQTEEMRRMIARHGIPEGKMTPVPMGVPEELIALGARRDVEPLAGRVVYVGTLARARRLEVLIRSMSKVRREVPDAHLVLVGDGVIPEDRQFLEKVVHAEGLEEAVVMTGNLPMTDAWEQARRAVVCVSPIIPTPVFRVGSPTKLVEYLALGRPVVANDHPEQSRVIRESGGGICCPWSESAFAEAILQLLRDPARAREMGERGREWVERNRRYDKIADSISAQYAAILGSSGGTR